MSPRAAWRLETLGFTQVYEYTPGKADWIAHGLPTEGADASDPDVGKVARKDVPTCSIDEEVEEVAERTGKAGFDTCFVVTGEGIVLGRLYQTQLQGDPGATVGEVMKEGPSTFRPNVSTEQMLHFMHEHELDTAPVSDSDGKLMGLVLREDLEE